MDDLLDQIEAASRAGLHYVALGAALGVPDICGALGAPNGRADGPRYRKWWDANLPEYGPWLPGERAYAFRNSLLHQGSMRHERRPTDRILVCEPGERFQGHQVTMDRSDGERVHIFGAVELVADIVQAAREWSEAHRDDDLVVKNLDRFVRRHPDGVSPFVIGSAVIG